MPTAILATTADAKPYALLGEGCMWSQEHEGAFSQQPVSQSTSLFSSHLGLMIRCLALIFRVSTHTSKAKLTDSFKNILPTARIMVEIPNNPGSLYLQVYR